MRRVSDKLLEFDPRYISSLMETPSDNKRNVAIAAKILREVIEEELSPRQQQVIQMFYYDSLREIEIARKLGVNISTVCRTRQRAERKIKRMMRFIIRYLHINSEGE